MSAGYERQSKVRKKKAASGLKRVETWLPAEQLAELKAMFPGAKGGVDWISVVEAALKSCEHPGTDVLLDSKSGTTARKPVPDSASLDNQPRGVLSYLARGSDVDRLCQAKNPNGERCPDTGTLIRTEMINGRDCDFDVCLQHEKAKEFTPHPSVLTQEPVELHVMAAFFNRRNRFRSTR